MITASAISGSQWTTHKIVMNLRIMDEMYFGIFNHYWKSTIKDVMLLVGTSYHCEDYPSITFNQNYNHPWDIINHRESADYSAYQ